MTDKPSQKVSKESKRTKKAALKAKSDQAKADKRLRKFGPKAQTSFRRNILPIIAGLVVVLGVFGAMNGQLVMAQWRYHFATPKITNVAQTSADLAKNKSAADDTKSPTSVTSPQVTIPSIGVIAPLQFDQGTAEWQIQLGLRKGVVHYDGSAKPGDTGNVVLFGHSSGQPWAPGDYKFVFTLLDKTKAGDLIYLDYHGTRYTYEIRKSQVVAPTDTGVLTSGNDHELTLITCTPVGTSTNRLVVHAEQISPKPVDTAPTQKAAPSLKTLPGTAE